MRHERYFNPSLEQFDAPREPLAAPSGLWRGIKFALPVSAVLWALIFFGIWWLL
jgi:hypothetical protein